jgi:uncharacterized protein (UPF0335 family)
MPNGSNTVLSDEQLVELINALDALDTEIETLQSSKRDLLTDARERMSGASKDDVKRVVAAVKQAVAKLRKQRNKPEAAEQDAAVSDLAEHLLSLVVYAPRATRSMDWATAKAATGSEH